MNSPSIPVIDFSPFLSTDDKDSPAKAAVAAAIGAACEEYGFFCLKGHGIDAVLLKKQDQLSREFFALPLAQKMQISMDRGGRAWRGFFAVGGELTSGFADLKEGLYFGQELTASDARVQKQTPLHGANLFPALPGFREAVLEYIAAQTRLGHQLMQAISLSLSLTEDHFYKNYTWDPTVLYRIFHYPAESVENATEFAWGVGEHTDYGVLTMLAQDDCGGLQVKSRGQWIDIPPLDNVLVCNVGDMLDFMTHGKYLSAPHRVKNQSGRSRLSFPFFFDPSFEARMKALPLKGVQRSGLAARWDQANLYSFDGTYGEYLHNKVAKVFPQLSQSTKK